MFAFFDLWALAVMLLPEKPLWAAQLCFVGFIQVVRSNDLFSQAREIESTPAMSVRKAVQALHEGSENERFAVVRGTLSRVDALPNVVRETGESVLVYWRDLMKVRLSGGWFESAVSTHTPATVVGPFKIDGFFVDMSREGFTPVFMTRGVRVETKTIVDDGNLVGLQAVTRALLADVPVTIVGTLSKTRNKTGLLGSMLFLPRWVKSGLNRGLLPHELVQAMHSRSLSLRGQCIITELKPHELVDVLRDEAWNKLVSGGWLMFIGCLIWLRIALVQWDRRRTLLLMRQQSHELRVSASRERLERHSEGIERTEGESEFLCIVCCELFRDCVMLPCGHLMCCNRCAGHVRMSSRNACPACRQPIMSTLSIRTLSA